MPKPIPEGYHSVTPYLIVDDANAAIKFYQRAFGATEKFRMPMGDRVGHAELEIGDSVVMLADEFPDMGHLGPNSRGGPTSSILLYVEDVDGAFNKAINAGATQPAVGGPVLGRSHGDADRPVRASMEPRDTCRRCAAGRDAAADARDEFEAEAARTGMIQ